ncbi:CrcB-like protein [Cordyceps fumosorosea ARSEF 2679]|uniref:CrcB-like protein n=1 Tax=Cordyceps fumosorosea (strain ARSEF 2679) TaxID=1081104 RepID=A0A168ETS3_CORFA|nr:CrcB-like protein [Cordyceps fumosorosea ARSEF 2679]OAA74211.1 CrcB-like protein [Cordyceps fumosorosea ARSEF 2679]
MAPEAALGSGGPHNHAASTTDDDGSSPYDIPDRYENLDELAATSDAPLDDIRSGEQQVHPPQPQIAQSPLRDDEDKAAHEVSRLATQVYTLSYLVLFAIFGTLARVGLAHLTAYPGAPAGSFPTLWANVGGSLVMGFLVEDRKLFRYEWGTSSTSATYDAVLRRRRAGSAASVDLAAAKRAHLAAKKTIPLYIGLATGFCGSFTSFSTFIRDVFLALSNDMVGPDLRGLGPESRPAGDSVMAVLAVIIQTVGLSLAAYRAGAHLGAALEPYTPSVPSLGRRARHALDALGVFLGWGCWLGAVLLAIFPPHERWRGTVVFAIVFAPLGCLARFYLALLLNARRPSFPLGTFAANILGTMILGAAWDIAHSAASGGGVLGCQLLQGVEDGFCGCLTTVSTWVAELSSLRRRSAYVYGVVSVALATALMVVIMGSLRWTQGFAPLQCHP